MPTVSRNSTARVYFWVGGDLSGLMGANGFDDGAFNSPISVVVGPTGNIYVTDYGNWRVHKFGFPTDISIAKSVSKNKATIGSILSYIHTITNTGPNLAYNINVTETYPTGFTFDTADPVPDSGNNQWNLGNMAAGAYQTITMTGTVTATSTLTNTAAVETSTSDLDSDNNSISAATDVNPAVRVGGEVNPTNSFRLVAPWIILALMLGARYLSCSGVKLTT